MLLLLIFTIITCLIPEISGHGRLMDPPSRNSMWRFGFDNPVNWNDNELYCGGKMIQWLRNDGKCGVCGDAFHGSRHHEAGGKYATGLISRTFTEGDLISITVHLTANHLGFFEFRICPNNDPKKSVTQECLDKYLLERPNSEGTRYFVPKGKYNSFFNYTLKLPDGLTCDQCVLQWKYRTGNTWDKDGASGLFCLGCGPQEEFYNCADIAIEPRSGMKKKRYDLLQSNKKQIATRPTILPTKRKKKTRKDPPKSPFLTNKPTQRPTLKATTTRPKTTRRKNKLTTTHRSMKKTQKLKTTKKPTTRYKKEPITRKPSSWKPVTAHQLSISKHTKPSKRTTTNKPRTTRMKPIKNGMGEKKNYENTKPKKLVTKRIPWSTKTVNPKITTTRKLKTKKYTNHGKITSKKYQTTAMFTKSRHMKETEQTKPERIKHILNGQHGSMNGKDNRPMLIANDIRTRKPTTKSVRSRLKTTIKTTRRTPKPTTKRLPPRVKTTIKSSRRTPKPTTKGFRLRLKSKIKSTTRTPKGRTNRLPPRLKTTIKTTRRRSNPTTKRVAPRLKTTIKTTIRTPKPTTKRLPPRLITVFKTTRRRTTLKSTTSKRTVHMTTKKTATMATPKYKIKNPYKTIKPRPKLVNVNPKRTSQHIQRRTTSQHIQRRTTTKMRQKPQDNGQKTKLKYETIRLKQIVVPITRSSRATTKSTTKIPRTQSAPSDKTRKISKSTWRSPKNPYTPKVILRRTTLKKYVTSHQRPYTPKAISTMRKNSPTRGLTTEKLTTEKKQNSRSTKNRFTTETAKFQTKQKSNSPSHKRTYSPKYKISIKEQTLGIKTTVQLSTIKPKITTRHKRKPSRRNPFATNRLKFLPTITTMKVSHKVHIIKKEKGTEITTSNAVGPSISKVTTKKSKATRRSPKNPYTSKSTKHLSTEPKTTVTTNNISSTTQKLIPKLTLKVAPINRKTSRSGHKKRTTLATKWPMRPKKNPFHTKSPITKRSQQTTETHAQKETTSSHKTIRTTQYPMTKTTETPQKITSSLVRLHSVTEEKTTLVKQMRPVKNPYSTQPPSRRTTIKLSKSSARITSLNKWSKQAKHPVPTKTPTRQITRKLSTSSMKTTSPKKWGRPKKNPFLTKPPKASKIITLSSSTALPKSSRTTSASFSKRQDRTKVTRHRHGQPKQKTHTIFVQETTTTRSKIPKIDLIRMITKHPLKISMISQSWLIPDKSLTTKDISTISRRLQNNSRTMRRMPLTTPKHKQVSIPKSVRIKVTRNHSRTSNYKKTTQTTAKLMYRTQDNKYSSEERRMHTTRPQVRISTSRHYSNHIKNSRKWAIVQWTTRGPMKSADDIRSWLIPEKSPSRTKNATKADIIESSKRVTKRLPTTRIVQRSSKDTLTKLPFKAVGEFHSWLLSKDEYQPGLIHSETDTNWDANGFLKEAWTAAPFDVETKGKSLSWLIPAPTNLPIKQENSRISSIEPKLKTMVHSKTILSTTLIPCLSTSATNSASRSHLPAFEDTSNIISSIRRLIKESQKSTTKRSTTTIPPIRRLNEHSRKTLARNSVWEMTPMLKCKAINTVVAGMDKWCFLNCNTGNCPKHLCKCTEQERNIPNVPAFNDTESAISWHVSPRDKSTAPDHRRNDYIWSKAGELRCKAIGRYRGIQRIDDWCRATCKVVTCPFLICGCYRR